MPELYLVVSLPSLHSPLHLTSMSPRPLVLHVVLAAALLLQAKDTRLSWVHNPRETNGSWVADPAHHLAASTVRAIDSVVDKLQRDKSIEMAVVVIDSLDGLDPADAALLLHRRWG